MSKITDALQKAVSEREKQKVIQEQQTTVVPPAQTLKTGKPSIDMVERELLQKMKVLQGENAQNKPAAAPKQAVDLTEEMREKLSKNIVFFNKHVDSVVQDGFRVIRTNLITSGRCKSVLVTSATANDGKSFVAVNLAAVMAMAGDKVLLVDGHIRRPKLAEMFDMENVPGLMEVLIVGSGWRDVMHETPIANLSFIPSGYPFKNHIELMGGERMDALLQEWEKEFDTVIIDSCPISGEADSLMLATKTKGVVLAIKMNKTYKEATIYAKNALKRVNAKILGFVLTDVKSFIPKFISKIVG